MKGDITNELPAVIENGEPEPYPLPPVINGEPDQRGGAILDLFGGCVISALAIAVIVVLLLQAVVR